MMQIVDLSHTIQPEMPVYPGTAPPELNVECTVEKDGFMETKLTLFTHTGTHIDCPAHIFEDGATTQTIDINDFCGKAMAINCSGLKTKQLITKQLLQKFTGTKPLCDFLLLYTGYSEYWGTKKYFHDFPTLDKNALDWIISSKIKGIGIDAISVDPVGTNDLKNHKHLLSNEIVIIENLTNMQLILNQRFYFSAFPLKIQNGDGSPVRAIAYIDNLSNEPIKYKFF